MTPNTLLDKASYRNLYKLARAHIGSDYAEKAAMQFTKRFLAHVHLHPDDIIAGYMPKDGEIDILPCLTYLCKQGAVCALPVIEGNNAPLVFRQWSEGDVLTPHKQYGILEPESSKPVVIPNIIITPLLACTVSGIRLGYGKGFYDRTIAALRMQKKIQIIGACFACQIADNLPEDDNDQRLDRIITEKSVYP